jgi:hypothetical protein
MSRQKQIEAAALAPSCLRHYGCKVRQHDECSALRPENLRRASPSRAITSSRRSHCTTGAAHKPSAIHAFTVRPRPSIPPSADQVHIFPETPPSSRDDSDASRQQHHHDDQLHRNHPTPMLRSRTIPASQMLPARAADHSPLVYHTRRIPCSTPHLGNGPPPKAIGPLSRQSAHPPTGPGVEKDFAGLHPLCQWVSWGRERALGN